MLGQARGLQQKINALIRKHDAALDRGDQAAADSLHRIIVTLVKFRAACVSGKRISPSASATSSRTVAIAARAR